MIVERVELTDVRSYRRAAFDFTPGVTVVVGDNGRGKTNLVEALAYLATLESFRGAPADALVRVGATEAVIRASIVDDDGRRSLIEAELGRGVNRVFVNKQRLQRARDLLGVMRVTVFAPDDLTIVKEGPGERRRFLDDTLVALAARYDATRLELDKVIRQRNTLLRHAGGHLDDTAALTLDVWDAKLVEVGEWLGHARATLVDRLRPMVDVAYGELSGELEVTGMGYDPAWRSSGLAAALAEARAIDVRRGASTVGPHRDELELAIRSMPARTHASQGEQRTLALSLRLAGHRLVAERTGSTPLLVLDDVLSELDASRAASLLYHLPDGQVVITTAGDLPAAAAGARVIRLRHGADGTTVDGADAVTAPDVTAAPARGRLADDE